MKLKELKEWMSKLPDEAGEYDVVLAVIGQTDDKQYWYRKDDPVYALDLDRETGEVLFMRYSSDKINADELVEGVNESEGSNENADS